MESCTTITEAAPKYLSFFLKKGIYPSWSLNLLMLPRPSSSSSIAYDDDMAVDGAVVLPSVNVSRLQKLPCPVAAGPFGGRTEAALEMLASAKFCKSLLSCSQASSTVLLHDGGGTAPLLGMGEHHHVAYVPPPPVHRLQGPSSVLHAYNKGPSNTGNQKEEAKVDLRSRGLCLVPLACTSYVTNENGVWAPPEH